MKLLHLDSSIQGETSASRAVSAAIVARLRATHEGLDTRYRDLAADPLPHLTLPGYATGEAAAVLDEFLEADIVVIGAPMYNFGMPSQLKAWFDHILVAGKTFRYGANGPEGLAGAKKVIVALSRGGVYSQGPAAPMEHAEAHLRTMLGFIGVSDVEFVVAEGVALGAEQRETAIEAAFAHAGRIAPVAAAA
ncbi:FMN-dependent NADH-azoreductase [Sphingomonas naasensis]|uniref:FMN dependent NADH:quinone oxidoreductase n=1 Tax=Sphingomonas naasensis TaxID=1344951 RepID=A0A4S1WTU1_9SPHN|nr:NAD(P)H-dependent oxidoreductase [Sphingomonas naasensis]NIJ19344.1 FMN-dependent NADH-azoreductase [Sphingomonas naasensis]TGX46513.1 FMN-dependent NADH-azoreductase [Sphingomonas naasensis]